MNSQIPLLSVIIACYNSERDISKSIESFISQTYTNKELIVIDGGSKDGTFDILKKFSAHISYWESTPDGGIYNAWNKGLKHANGDWICFIGSDDFFWDETVLERYSLELQKINSDFYKIVYGKIALINSTNEILGYIGAPWVFEKRTFFKAMSIPHVGLMHHKSLFYNSNFFNEKFKIAGDYEFLLRELKRQDPVFIEEIIIAGMKIGGISSNRKLYFRIIYEEALARYINGINPFSSIFFKRLFFAIGKIIGTFLFGKTIFNFLKSAFRQ